MQSVGDLSRRVASVVWHRFNAASDAAFDASYEFVDDAVDKTLSCTECGGRVQLLERFCPTCDQAYPVRLHWKAAVLLFGLPILLAFVLNALQ